MNKTKERISRDMQVEKRIAQMIFDNVWVGLENGQVRLWHVHECAEKIREYFEGLYETDPTAI